MAKCKECGQNRQFETGVYYKDLADNEIFLLVNIEIKSKTYYVLVGIDGGHFDDVTTRLQDVAGDTPERLAPASKKEVLTWMKENMHE